jgi:uncharacterized lipoprotein YddW (UPF0748 family)
MTSRLTPSCVFGLSVLLAACGEPGQAPDAATAFDATSPDARVDRVDAQMADVGSDAPLPVDVVPVSHPRAMRGVWVSTISNLDFPSRTGLTAAQGRAELAAIVTRAHEAGFNALFFQVRPESDALYASTLEPWSRALTGTQGNDPGYDPLAVLLELAHAQNIEVHAWLNPYRASASAGSATASNHVTRTLSAHAIRYGAGIVMDPSAAPVRAHVVSVIEDILTRYDVDGIHFDDYFYPYPDMASTPFPDQAAYDAYRMGGGMLTRGDWRRENVNALVRDVHELVLRTKPNVRFGISPFGIYRPDMPTGIRGLDAYATIYCDSVHWMNQDWVDYLAPQLYWPTTPAAQAFEPLVTWWGTTAGVEEHIFAGHAAYRLGSTATWTIGEMNTQLDIVNRLSSSADSQVRGSLFFRYSNIDDDTSGIRRALVTRYATPAVPPSIPRALSAPALPNVIAGAGSIAITHPSRESVRTFGVYRASGSTFVLDRLAPASTTTLTLAAGVWVVSAIGVGDYESQGVRVTVR